MKHEIENLKQVWKNWKFFYRAYDAEVIAVAVIVTIVISFLIALTKVVGVSW